MSKGSSTGESLCAGERVGQGEMRCGGQREGERSGGIEVPNSGSAGAYVRISGVAIRCLNSQGRPYLWAARRSVRLSRLDACLRNGTPVCRRAKRGRQQRLVR
jgi:hypothetical protein